MAVGTMTPRERVLTALQHRVPDRVPRFEIWIDGLLKELGQADIPAAHVHLGQDGVMMPSQRPRGSNAWESGIDEWGRVWKDGLYVSGVVQTEQDLRRYGHPASYAEEHFNPQSVQEVRARYPHHCHFFGSHEIGPFTISFMAMGLEQFFLGLRQAPGFVRQLLANRTDWCIAMSRRAVELGAELLVVGDDAAHSSGPMISPRMWEEFVLPCHRRLVQAVSVPVIWHSDGNIEQLLPFAVQAGFAGVHGLQPSAGMDLARIKQQYGQELVLIGNVDLAVLFGADLRAVRAEVDRCLRQGAPGGGYMLATCNSICEGMHPAAVAELFRYEAEVGCGSVT